MKEAEVRETFTQLNSKLEKIGNLVHDSVQISHDEVMISHIGFASICLHIILNQWVLFFQANNFVIRSWDEKQMQPRLKSHVQLVELLEIADVKRGINSTCFEDQHTCALMEAVIYISF